MVAAGKSHESREALVNLTRLYWYTVEFGLIRQQGELRIYGSGIVSSKGESIHCLESASPNRIGFDLRRIMRTRYRIDTFQKAYFVIDSFDQLMDANPTGFSCRSSGLPRWIGCAVRNGIGQVYHVAPFRLGTAADAERTLDRPRGGDCGCRVRDICSFLRSPCMKFAIAGAVLAGCLASPARAEVTQAAADHFLIGFSADVAATPTRTYEAIQQVQHWWSAEHTWSGDATNLSLKAEAGGCFCERWKQGSSEHGRVVMAVADELLRLQAALGPLQEYALNGMLSFQLAAGVDGTTQLNVDYRVNGASASDLGQFAPAVDRVLALQIDVDCYATSIAAIRSRLPRRSSNRRRANARLARC